MHHGYPDAAIPGSLIEQIVCDADLFHFGTDDFAERNKLMRKEAEATRQKDHEERMAKGYHSIPGGTSLPYRLLPINLLEDKKKQNLKELLRKIKQGGSAVGYLRRPRPMLHAALCRACTTGTARKPKIDRPERGIETMFRISSSNHQRLSDMADNKAHIMITTTSIIISVLAECPVA